MKDVLEIDDADDIKFQRVHRMGKPRKDGHGSHTIIAHFLRFPDRERVFKCGRKLKGTDYKMYEFIPKELHELKPISISYTLTENILNCNSLLYGL